MIESLEQSDYFAPNMALFSSDSVILDLDSNLTFENITCINEEDLFNSGKLDHSYSQSSAHAAQGSSESKSTTSCQAPEILLDISSSEIVYRPIDIEHSSQESIENSSLVDTSQLLNECFSNEKQCDAPRSQSQVSEDSKCLMSHQNLPSNIQDFKRNEVFQSGFSLSFLLEETTSLDFDLENLLQDESSVRSDLLQQPLSESDLLNLDLDKFQEIESSGALALMNQTDNPMIHAEEVCSHRNFQTLYDTDQLDIPDIDFSSDFMSDASHWSSLSTTSTVGDFPLDIESTEPLSLEELFTRTFNEELHREPLSTGTIDSFLPEQDANLSRAFINNMSAESSSPWINGRWHNDYFNELGISVEVNPCLWNETDSSIIGTETSDHSDSVISPTSVGITKQFSGRNEHLSKGDKTSTTRGHQSNHQASSQDFTDREEQRLTHVRKYQRLSTNGCSQDTLKRSFQCSYPECQRFYAKLSHLKAHLRRHNGERSFKCDWQDCQWQFSRSDELSRHRRSHYGIKPYPCTLCVKRFTRSDHLAKHLKVHERQKHKMMMKALLRKTKTKNSKGHIMKQDQS